MKAFNAISLPRLVLAGAAVCAPLAGAAEAGGDTGRRPRQGAMPHASYSSIQQAAVDTAQPGDTVKVCADRYPEQVTVDKPLTVHGESPAADAAEAETGVDPVPVLTGSDCSL